VREESGYEVELTGLLAVYQSILPDINVCSTVFAAKVVGGEVKPTVEHPEIRWCSIEELRELEAKKRLFTSYPVYAAELLPAGKVLPLDSVVCVRAD
jgi:ADP-ribose pyrophosphatase YjhB (NUDIX family)